VERSGTKDMLISDVYLFSSPPEGRVFFNEDFKQKEDIFGSATCGGTQQGTGINYYFTRFPFFG
jgi:hypothetical protein